MQYLDTLPAEVLELVLNEVKDPVDLINCSSAHPRLDAQLQKRKSVYLLSRVLPFITPMLEVQDVLKISEVFKGGRDAVQDFDNHVPGRQPYNDQSYLRDMQTLGKDPAEHKWNTDVWYLSFHKIYRDIQRFKRELKSRLDQDPFAVGKSAYFDVSHGDFRIQQIQLQKLAEFIETYGQHFYYVKLRLTAKYTLALPGNCEYIFGILANLPNARLIELNGDFNDDSPFGQELIPYLPHLESLALSLGNRNSEKLEGAAIANHAHQLKKLKLTARPGNLQKHFPCLVELHVHAILLPNFFDDLLQLEAPLLQKLTLEFLHTHSNFDSAVMLEKIAHFPLRHLTLKWTYPNENMNCNASPRSAHSRFRKIQFPSVHTLTLCNFPDDWSPLLVSFPSLTYLNIRINIFGTTGQKTLQKLQKREVLRIKKVLIGWKPKVAPFVADISTDNFPELRQVSFEVWKTVGCEVSGKLVHCRKWTRNLKGSANASSA